MRGATRSLFIWLCLIAARRCVSDAAGYPHPDGQGTENVVDTKASSDPGVAGSAKKGTKRHSDLTRKESDMISKGQELLSCVSNKSTKCIRKALKGGAPVDYADLKLGGMTPLISSALKGHMGATKALLKAGADRNKRDQLGSTALMAASLKGHLKVVKLLLKKGARVNAADKEGGTALMAAAHMNNIDIVAALLEADADPLQKNLAGNDAMDFVTTVGFKGQIGRKIKEMLLEVVKIRSLLEMKYHGGVNKIDPKYRATFTLNQEPLYLGSHQMPSAGSGEL